jgi:hypothetical protein
MCEYSLRSVASRPAKIGDDLVVTSFPNSFTRGFAAVGQPDVAVCLVPGTELAFEKEACTDRLFWFLPNRKLGSTVARFCRINENLPSTHQDALEFPSGEKVLLTNMSDGQCARVIQLPATARTGKDAAAPIHSQPKAPIAVEIIKAGP